MSINIRYAYQFIVLMSSVYIMHASDEEIMPREKFLTYVSNGPEEYFGYDKDIKLKVTGHVLRLETWGDLKKKLICTLRNNSLVLETPISLVWKERIREDKDYVPCTFFDQQEEKPKILICKENTKELAMVRKGERWVDERDK